MPAGAILRVGGSKKGMKAFLVRSGLAPHRVYLRGAPTSAGAKTVARHNYFLVVASNAPETDFPLQLKEASRFLKRHMRALKTLPRYKLHAVIDFAVSDTRTTDSPMLSWRLPQSFIQLLHKTAIDAEISVV